MMIVKSRVILLFVAVVASLTRAVAAPHEAQPLRTLVYTFTISGGVRAHAPPQFQHDTFTMTVAIKSTDRSGTRHAIIALHAPKGQSISETPEGATVAPSGAIHPEDARTEAPLNDMTQAEVTELNATYVGALMTARLRSFNSFAVACARQKKLTPGTSWSGIMRSGRRTLNVVYTSKSAEQRAGRSTMLVTMQSSTLSGPQFIGEGYYDPLARLVVSMHYDGPATFGGEENETVDITL